MVKVKKRSIRGKKGRGHIRQPSFVYRRWLLSGGIIAAVLCLFWGVSSLFQNWPMFVAQTEEAIAKIIEARVKTIMVAGVKNTPPEELKTALGLEEGSSLVGFDARAARARVEGLDWVQTAYVVRVLPSTVRVNVDEHTPIARLEEEGVMWLVADDGHLITPAEENFAELPIIRGEAARDEVGTLFEVLAQVPEVKEYVNGAIYVGKRRWDLRLKSGGVVKLPAEGMLEALAYLVLLHKERQIMDVPEADVDLRLQDRIVLRLPDHRAL